MQEKNPCVCCPTKSCPSRVVAGDVSNADRGESIVEQPSGLLEEAMETRRLNTEFIKSEVARGLDDARKVMRVGSQHHDYRTEDAA